MEAAALAALAVRREVAGWRKKLDAACRASLGAWGSACRGVHAKDGGGGGVRLAAAGLRVSTRLGWALVGVAGVGCGGLLWAGRCGSRPETGPGTEKGREKGNGPGEFSPVPEERF